MKRYIGFGRDFNSELSIEPQPHDLEAYQQAKAQAQGLESLPDKLHFKFDRSLEGEELADALKAQLEAHDIDPSTVLVRYFASTQLACAVQTGTDRTETSSVGNRDGEETWCCALRIWGAQAVTYASPIWTKLIGGADTPKAQHYSYLIYDKRHLHPVGHASNGFHCFLTSPHQALIGFVSDQGTLPLLKPKMQKTVPARPKPF